MSKKLKVEVICWDLFSQKYPLDGISFTEMPDTFVSEGISDKEIGLWTAFKYDPEKQSMPVIISAQTGKGKNYFITHNLREYALRNNQRILYVSNRVALDFQQKKELSDLTYSNYHFPFGDVDALEKIEVFSNVTVITYHKLLRYFSEKDKEWFASFDFVVLDECHFFYSDAAFNPYTWYILEESVKRFRNCVRIYMSATIDDVVEPIRYFEGDAFTDKSSLEPFAYQFPRDYSSYQQNYFSELGHIKDCILESPQKEKWVVFVEKKETGKWLTDCLNEGKEDMAVYLDSGSRRSSNIAERITWEMVKAEGKFKERVLVTTSVLDNGFSIRDKNICHIVLCTNDKTEFLQELGRCRLEKDQTVNLYIKKLENVEHRKRKNIYQQYHELAIAYYGKDEYGKDIREGDPIGVVQALWNSRNDNRRNAICLINQENGTLRPQFNGMLRWRVRLLGEQLSKYEKMLECDAAAPIRYKADWLGDVQICLDLDKKGHSKGMSAFLNFLDDYIGKELKENESSFSEFSTRFVQLYKAVFPTDSSVRRGNDRPAPKHKFINSHLDNLKEETGECYVLEQKEGNVWALEKRKELSEINAG